MEIHRVRKTKEFPEGGTIVDVDIRDAHEIIKSISAQLVSGNPNVGREEFYSDKGEYFSIGVHKDLVKRREALEEFERMSKK